MDTVEYFVLASISGINTNQSKSTELSSIKVRNQKIWIKPEIRQINFKATASGGATTTDGTAQS